MIYQRQYVGKSTYLLYSLKNTSTGERMRTTKVVDMRAMGELVLLLRRRENMSQYDLAGKAGVDVMTISRLERGTKKRLEVEILARLAQTLGITTDQLLGLDTCQKGRVHVNHA